MAKRITISLGDDIVDLMRKEIRHSGVSFNEAVNHYLRLGLMAAKQPAMGLSPGLS